jgi:hypothetical protein
LSDHGYGIHQEIRTGITQTEIGQPKSRDHAVCREHHFVMSKINQARTRDRRIHGLIQQRAGSNNLNLQLHRASWLTKHPGIELQQVNLADRCRETLR